MKLPITGWKTTLGALGYKVVWKKEKVKDTRRRDRRNTPVNYGPLEPRQMLASDFFVSASGDNVDGLHGPGQLTFREAIQLANASSGIDNIVFDSAISGQTIAIGSDLISDEATVITGIESTNINLAGGVSLELTDSAVSDLSVSGNGILEFSGSSGMVQNARFTAGLQIRPSAENISIQDTGINHAHITFPEGAGVSATFARVSLESVDLTPNYSGVSSISFTDASIIDSDLDLSHSALVTFDRSTVENGSVSFAYGDARLQNTTISGASGHGIRAAFATVNIVSSTITNNGVGLDAQAGATVVLQNSIVAGNGPAGDIVHADNNFYGSDVSGNFNLIGVEVNQNSFTSGIDGNIVIDGNDPGLAPLANNGGLTSTHAVQPGSPAENAGANGLALSADGSLLGSDQRGAERFNGRVDIGAFELTSSTLDGLLTISPASDFNKQIDSFPQVFSGTVATYRAADGESLVPSEYTAIIRWGDGKQSTVNPVAGSSADELVIAGDHTYRIFGEVPFEVELVHRNGDAVTNSAAVDVFASLHQSYDPDRSRDRTLTRLAVVVEEVKSTVFYFENSSQSSGEGEVQTLEFVSPAGDRLVYSKTGNIGTVSGIVGGRAITMLDDQYSGSVQNSVDGVYSTFAGGYRGAFAIDGVSLGIEGPGGQLGEAFTLLEYVFAGNSRLDDFTINIDWGVGTQSQGRMYLLGAYDPAKLGRQLREISVVGDPPYQANDHVAEFVINAPAGVDLLDDFDRDKLQRVDLADFGESFNYGSSRAGKVRFGDPLSELGEFVFSPKVPFFKTAGVSQQKVEGVVATLRPGANADFAPEDFKATIWWGDGSFSEGSIDRGFGNEITVSGEHQYDRFGEIDFIVQLQHASGQSIGVADSITVKSRSPVIYQAGDAGFQNIAQVDLEVEGFEEVDNRIFSFDRFEQGTSVAVYVNGTETIRVSGPADDREISGQIEGRQVLLKDSFYYTPTNNQGDFLYTSLNGGYRGSLTTLDGNTINSVGTGTLVVLQIPRFKGGHVFDDFDVDIAWGGDLANSEKGQLVLTGEDFSGGSSIQRVVVHGTKPLGSGNQTVQFRLNAPYGNLWRDGGNGEYYYGSTHVGEVDFRDNSFSGDPVVDVVGAQPLSGYEGERLQFQFALSHASDQVVCLHFGSLFGGAGDAIEGIDYRLYGDDYNSTTREIRFQPGTTTTTIDVEFLSDDLREGDESFAFEILNVENGRLGEETVFGGLIKDPVVSIAIDADERELEEGNAGQGNVGFREIQIPVTRSGTTSGSTTVHWQVEGTDVSGDDFSGTYSTDLPSGTVIFAAGESTQEIVLLVSGDTDVEFDEPFTVILSDATDSQDDHVVEIVTAETYGTIVNDDIDLDIQTPYSVFKPTLADFLPYDPAGQDGRGGAPSVATVSPDGSTITLRGNSWKAVPLGYNVTRDTILEFEFFSDTQGEIHGFLFDQDLSFSTATGRNTFQLWGTQPYARGLHGDLYPSYGEFTTGTWQTYKIPVGEVFTGYREYLTFINDNDGINSNGISSFRGVKLYERSAYSPLEGNSGTSEIRFPITRQGDLAGTTTVHWQVESSATTSDDFTGDYTTSLPSGTITFAPGEQVVDVAIEIVGDFNVEADKLFNVVLSAPIDSQANHIAELLPTNSNGTIENDDIDLDIQTPYSVFKPTLADFLPYDPAGQDGRGGAPSVATVSPDGSTITLRGNSWKAVPLGYNVTRDTILEFEFFSDTQGEIHGFLFDQDLSFSTASGRNTFQLWGTQPYTRGLHGDLYPSYGEFTTGTWQTYKIPVGEVFTGYREYLTFINDNDGINSNGISSFRGVKLYERSAYSPLEGNSGTSEIRFPVTRQGDLNGTTTVQWRVESELASPGDFSGDYSGSLPSGTIAFLPGVADEEITVNIVGDNRFELDETFTVILFDPNDTQLNHHVDIAAASATAIIQNDDELNSAPYFTSPHVVDAHVGAEFVYNSTASDSEGDSLVFSVGEMVYPEGFQPTEATRVQFDYIHDGADQRGVYTWMPPAELSGQRVQITEIVSDGINDPVTRTFEVYVHPVGQNHAPVITSEPDSSYQKTSGEGQVVGVQNNDPTSPSSIFVELENGEEAKFEVSLSPELDGQQSADIVIVFDTSGSMTGARDWLVQSPNPESDSPLPSVLEQINQKLNLLGISDVRYGLANMNNYRPVLLSPGVADPYWTSSVDTLQSALDSLHIAGDGESGQLAIAETLDPGSVYQLRPEAVVNIMLFSDDQDTNGYDDGLQQQIIDTLIGNPETVSDDILFTSIVSPTLAANDGEGNIALFSSGPGNSWGVTPTGLRSAGTEAATAVVEFDDVLQQAGFSRQHRVNDFSLVTRFQITNEGAEQKAQILFGSASDLDGGQPSRYWSIQADASTGLWAVTASNEANPIRNFQLHDGVQASDVDFGQSVELEARFNTIFPNDSLGPTNGQDYQRIDLFINGAAFAFVELYEFVGSFNSAVDFVGVGAGVSVVEYDFIEISLPTDVNGYSMTGGSWNVTDPEMPTPRDFQESSIAAKRVFINNFGTADGYSPNEEILGADFGGFAYLPDGEGNYQIRANPEVVSAYRNQQLHYTQLSRAVNGSVWDLSVLRDPDVDEFGSPFEPDGPGNQISAELRNTRISFANAFSDSFSKEILLQRVKLVSDSPLVTNIQPAFPADPDSRNFTVTITGNGADNRISLNFVAGDAQNSALGSIPVWVSGNYTHDFEVFDVENDRAFRFAFDPDFVNDDGEVITHGAQLVNSGRDGMLNDRLIWVPPEVTAPEDFQFRGVVYDAAGQVGTKDWTVTVYPESTENSAPAISVEGLEIQNDTPVLAPARVLDSYQYQVVANDADPQDPDILSFYLVPAVSDNGTISQAESWLTIDRNTGIISGRPGPADIGTHRFAVVVSDGKFSTDANGLLIPSETRQEFLIEVNERTALNKIPVLQPIPDLAVRSGRLFEYRAEASDLDNNALEYKVVNGPEGLFIDGQSGLIRWKPTLEDVSDDATPVTISVTDGISTATQTFRLVVASTNRSPEITTELPAGVVYQDYIQKLEAFDPDFQEVRFSLINGPEGLIVDRHPDPQNHSFYIYWPRDAIVPGTHLISVQANDGAGAVVTKEYRVSFLENPVPQVQVQPHTALRETFAATIPITITSQSPIASAQLDLQSLDRGLQLIQTDTITHANYESQTFELNWTPNRAGNFKVLLTAENETGTVKHEFVIKVYPFVDAAENQAPVFDGDILGPFDRDQLVVMPLDVIDQEGHTFTTQILDGVAPAILNNNQFRFHAAAPGIFQFVVGAHENDDLGETGWDATRTQPFEIAILDNAAPTLYYGYQGTAFTDTDYNFAFESVERNWGDKIRVRLNQQALDAGVELNHPAGDRGGIYSIHWPAEKIAQWLGDNRTTGQLPITIVAQDNHGESVSGSFHLNVQTPAPPVIVEQNHQIDILAGRLWQVDLVDPNVVNDLTFAVATPDDPANPFPEGIVVSSDGHVEWTPAIDLLYSDQGGGVLQRQDSVDFEFSVDVSRAGTVVATLTVVLSLNDPARADVFTPELDLERSPFAHRATADAVYSWQPVLKDAPTNPTANSTVDWVLEDAPEGMEISSAGLITWAPDAELIGERVRKRRKFSKCRKLPSWTK